MLKTGDKVMFIRESGVLTGKPFDVVTFLNYYSVIDSPLNNSDEKYFQCKELIDEFPNHNFLTATVIKYEKPRFLTKRIIRKEEKEHFKKFGNPR